MPFERRGSHFFTARTLRSLIASHPPLTPVLTESCRMEWDETEPGRQPDSCRFGGDGMRIVFIHWFPFSSGDSDLYQELATICSIRHLWSYAAGSLIAAALRMPDIRCPDRGEWLIGPGNERLFCGASRHRRAGLPDVAWLAEKLAEGITPAPSHRPVDGHTVPFTANYTATPLTETLTVA